MLPDNFLRAFGRAKGPQNHRSSTVINTRHKGPFPGIHFCFMLAWSWSVTFVANLVKYSVTPGCNSFVHSLLLLWWWYPFTVLLTAHESQTNLSYSKQWLVAKESSSVLKWMLKINTHVACLKKNKSSCPSYLEQMIFPSYHNYELLKKVKMLLFLSKTL